MKKISITSGQNWRGPPPSWHPAPPCPTIPSGDSRKSFPCAAGTGVRDRSTRPSAARRLKRGRRNSWSWPGGCGGCPSSSSAAWRCRGTTSGASPWIPLPERGRPGADARRGAGTSRRIPGVGRGCSCDGRTSGGVRGRHRNRDRGNGRSRCWNDRCCPADHRTRRRAGGADSSGGAATADGASGRQSRVPPRRRRCRRGCRWRSSNGCWTGSC
mmetsp:Transcript_9005/g.25283  ORF Transcript_9005/g.25283 Transcript_9005/m.25283 type:complete len:214 (-) Transcript_9005:131-772(-)